MSKCSLNLRGGVIILLKLANGELYQGPKGWDIRGCRRAKQKLHIVVHFGYRSFQDLWRLIQKTRHHAEPYNILQPMPVSGPKYQKEKGLTSGPTHRG